MLDEKQRAAVQPATPRCGNDFKFNNTMRPTARSSENLQEQLGLLLYHLQNPLTQRQCRMGWQLFEVVVRQYYDVKTSGGFENA